MLDQAGVSRCTVRLERHARVSSVAGIPAKLAAKVAREAINRVRASLGLNMLEECPAELCAIYEQQLAVEHPAIAQFLNRLDRDALAFARGHSSTDRLAVYNFLVAGSSIASRNRVQAMQSLPALLDLLVPPRSGTYAEAPAALACIVAAIDAGAPLMPSLAQVFGVPPETVRWLRDQALPQGWRMDERRMRLLLNVLSWIAPEKRPSSVAQFDDVIHIAQALASVLKPFFGRQQASQSLFAPPYSTVLKGWLGPLLRPDCSAGRCNLARLAAPASLAGAADFLTSLNRAVFRLCAPGPASAGEHNAACQELVLAWVDARSLRQLLDYSAQWHAALQNLATAAREPGHMVAPLAINRQWPLVLKAPLKVGRFTMLELGDESSLIDEGATMGHCVGTFSAQCLSGDSVIVSVRDENGNPVSTAELHVDDSARQVKLGQHCARQNAPPPPECQATVERLVRLLNGVDFRDALAERSKFQQFQYMRRAGRAPSERQDDAFHETADAAAWTLVTACPVPGATLEFETMARLMAGSSTRLCAM